MFSLDRLAIEFAERERELVCHGVEGPGRCWRMVNSRQGRDAHDIATGLIVGDGLDKGIA